jgi:carbon monoxide dehydrogenase subunit G
MEHESFVPTPSARVAESFRTPGAVASALPGWQPDPDAAQGDRVARGRLRLRIAGSTITYRGFVTVKGEAPPFALVARGTEVRGDGVVEVNARITLTDTDLPQPGTTVTYEGTAQAGGRLASYDPAVVEAAARRLLDRFSAGIATQTREAPSRPEPEPESGPADTVSPMDPTPAPVDPAPGDPAPAADTQQHTPDAEGAEDTGKPTDAAAADAAADDAADDAEAAAPERDDAAASDEAEAPHAPDTPDTPDAEEPDAEESDVVDDLGDPASELEEFELVEVEVEVPESAAALDDLVPPAEAAHARRTMIGRSAEEVDHAPPRGRYAPVPAPDATSAATLRWAAPAAAALLASAVVVGRVLRRRR